jgi:hypothetical protein
VIQAWCASSGLCTDLAATYSRTVARLSTARGRGAADPPRPPPPTGSEIGGKFAFLRASWLVAFSIIPLANLCA